MRISDGGIPGLLIIQPDVFGDERGFFLETWNAERYAEHGFRRGFVQDNLSASRMGVLRGLHFQEPGAQGKLVSVIEGEVFDVAVDIRLGSPTFGKWFGIHLSGKEKTQFFIPPGFAHGFVVLSDRALFMYKCTAPYKPQNELSILWNDPDIAIAWPTTDVTLSQKDTQALRLRDVPLDRLPRFSPGEA